MFLLSRSITTKLLCTWMCIDVPGKATLQSLPVVIPSQQQQQVVIYVRLLGCCVNYFLLSLILSQPRTLVWNRSISQETLLSPSSKNESHPEGNGPYFSVVIPICCCGSSVGYLPRSRFIEWTRYTRTTRSAAVSWLEPTLRPPLVVAQTRNAALKAYGHDLPQLLILMWHVECNRRTYCIWPWRGLKYRLLLKLKIQTTAMNT